MAVSNQGTAGLQTRSSPILQHLGTVVVILPIVESVVQHCPGSRMGLAGPEGQVVAWQSDGVRLTLCNH